jgi:hypothetical protein
VKNSLLDVQLCDEHSSRCSAVDETDKHRPFLLPRNSTEEKVNYYFFRAVCGFSLVQSTTV